MFSVISAARLGSIVMLPLELTGYENEKVLIMLTGVGVVPVYVCGIKSLKSNKRIRSGLSSNCCGGGGSS